MFCAVSPNSSAWTATFRILQNGVEWGWDKIHIAVSAYQEAKHNTYYYVNIIKNLKDRRGVGLREGNVALTCVCIYIIYNIYICLNECCVIQHLPASISM